MRRFLTSLCLLLNVAVFSQASSWYVRSSSSCPNNGNGTSSSCAASVGAPGAWNAFSNIAWSSVQPGDTIYIASVANESYSTGFTFGKSGTSGNPITVTVSGGHVATIDLGNIAGSTGIKTGGNSWVVLDGAQGNAAAGNLNYGIRVIHIASSSSSNSRCAYDNSGSSNFSVLHVECSGDSQVSPDDNGGGFYFGVTGSGKGGNELGYNWIHSARSPVSVVSITQSGGKATVTTATPHGYPSSGTFVVGIKNTNASGYVGTRWIATAVDATHFTFSCDITGACLSSSLGPASGGIAVWHWWATGITMWASNGTTSYNSTTVHDNLVENTFHDGIRCGSNCSLHDNTVKHVEGSGHSDSLLIQSGGYAAVYNNYVEGSGDQNIYIDNLYDSTCAHIRIYNNVLNSNPGFGIILDPEGAAGPGTAASTCTSGSQSSLDDVEILNNTFFTASASMIRKGRSNPVTNVVIANNIFGIGVSGGYNQLDLYNGSSVAFNGTGAWNYNVHAGSSATYITNYANSNSTLSQVQGDGYELSSHMGVPTYTNPAGNDFHLASSDVVATGQGVNLATNYPFVSLDKDGNSRPAGAWDLGAYAAAGNSTGLQPPALLTATVH